jgi:hypothetical protein
MPVRPNAVAQAGGEEAELVRSGGCWGERSSNQPSVRRDDVHHRVLRALAASVAVSDAKQEARQKKSGCWNCIPSPTSSIAASLVPDPDRYRSGLVAWYHGTARQDRDPDGSIDRRGFARRSIVPRLRGKCAHGRSQLAETPVNITLAGRGSRIGAVPYMALAGHGGSCERGCGDQRSRQKFKLSHSISPLIRKANSGWLR